MGFSFQDNEKLNGGGGRKYGGALGQTRALGFLLLKVSFHLTYGCVTLKETEAVPLGHRTLGSLLYGDLLSGHSDNL